MSNPPPVGLDSSRASRIPGPLAVAWRQIVSHPLAAALLLGLVLRLLAGDSRSLTYDDTFSIFLSQRSFSEILSGTAADTMPPLYYFLLHLWLGLGSLLTGGTPVWWIRLLTVGLNLAALALFYLLMERLFDRRAAGWAALFGAIAPLQIYHAQDVRMYSLLLVGQVGYLYFFARLFLSDRPTARRGWEWAGLVGCGAMTMYTHNVAIFGLVIPDAYLVLRRDWKGLIRLAAAQLVIGLLALPWLLLLPGQIAKVQRAWSLPQPGLIEVLQALIWLTANLPLPFALLVIASVLSLQAFVLLAMETWRLRRSGPGLLFLLCVLMIPPVLLFAASYVMKPMFISRAFLVSSLAFCGVAGLVAARTGPKGAGWLSVGAFILAVAVSMPSFYTYHDFPRSPYRQATEYLRQEAGTGVRIVHDNKLSAFPARFYAPDLNQVFVADPVNSPNDTFEPASQQAMQIFPMPSLEAAAGDEKEIYFVVFSNAIAEYRGQGLEDHPGLQWLNAHFEQVDRQVFVDLEIYHYRR